MSADPEELRRELDALRAQVEELERRVATPGADTLVEDEPLAPGALEVVVCLLGSNRIAIPLLCVDEVVMHAATAPLPESPPWVVGLLDLRGRLLTVVDVGARLAHRPSAPRLSDQVVVVSNGVGRVGLLVDEVVGVARFGRAGDSGAADVPFARYVREVLHDDGGVVLLLGIRRLVSMSDVTVDADSAA